MYKYVLMALACCCFFGLGSITIADEWVAYQVTPVIMPNINTTTHSQSYSISLQPQPIIVYQWVPYTTHYYTTIESRCLFRREQTLIVQPMTRWLYQPHIIYR